MAAALCQEKAKPMSLSNEGVMNSEKRASSDKRGNIFSFLLVLSFSVWGLNSISKDWLGTRHGGVLGWILLAVFIAAMLLYPLPIMRMKRKAIASATRGDYDEALRISRRWLRSKVYGRPFQGWIMLAAGRYSEALELLKDAAFDAKGHPLLKTQHLYFYAIALVSEERYSQAQPLLEAAVLASEKNGDYLRFGLAECLLCQNKEAGRALELVEHVRANLSGKPHSKQNRLRLAQCNKIGAWALAACGRREEAETRLQEAFAESDSFNKEDLAGLLNSKGSALQALGDRKRSREAFQQALSVFPHGSIAVFARRELLKLPEDVHE
jgi:tetratricopeptide (TPR) repeat protein